MFTKRIFLAFKFRHVVLRFRPLNEVATGFQKECDRGVKENYIIFGKGLYLCAPKSLSLGMKLSDGECHLHRQSNIFTLKIPDSSGGLENESAWNKTSIQSFARSLYMANSIPRYSL